MCASTRRRLTSESGFNLIPCSRARALGMALYTAGAAAGPGPAVCSRERLPSARCGFFEKLVYSVRLLDDRAYNYSKTGRNSERVLVAELFPLRITN